MTSEQELPNPIRRLLRDVGYEHETPRPRRIFTNRDLDFEKVPVVGFDMDYTLARYRQTELEALSLEATVSKLVAQGWPELLHQIEPDPEFAIRGLLVDTLKGNLLKMDRHGYVGRVYHGRTMLDRPQRKAIYRSQRVGRERTRFSYVDTLFSLPEVTLYAAVVDLIDQQPEAWADGAPDYATAWTAVREAIDLAHQDDSIKSKIRADVARYFEQDPDLAPTLHKLRSSGKKLFLLTNSYYPYTNVVMSYILGDEDDGYDDWAAYFDWVVVGSRKPDFFTKTEPFLEIDRSTGLRTDKATATPAKHRVYQGGNQMGLQVALGVSPDEILYVGDHIYGDIVQSKKTSGWRTVLIADELEREMRVRADYHVALEEIRTMSELWEELSEDVSDQRYLNRGLELLRPDAVVAEYAKRAHVTMAPVEAEALLEGTRTRARERLKRLRAHEDSVAEHVKLRSVEVDRAFNKYWGSVFAERYDASFFGAQLENYACLYTSRVSNFLFVSPHRYFRAPHGAMPHWS